MPAVRTRTVYTATSRTRAANQLYARKVASLRQVRAPAVKPKPSAQRVTRTRVVRSTRLREQLARVETIPRYRVILNEPPTHSPPLQRIAELEFSPGALTFKLDDTSAFSFTMRTAGAGAGRVKPMRTEVQLYEGSRRVFWGVVVRKRHSGERTEVSCVGIEWYFARRHAGNSERQNWLQNSTFGAQPAGERSQIERWQEGQHRVQTKTLVDAGGAPLGGRYLKLTETRVERLWRWMNGKGSAFDPTHYAKVKARGHIWRRGAPRTIDGVVVRSGDIVLLERQESPVSNGRWLVRHGDWVRPPGYNTGDEIRRSRVKVTEGKSFAGTGWRCTNSQGITVGKDPIYYSQYAYTEIRARSRFVRQLEDLDVGERKGSVWVARVYFRFPSTPDYLPFQNTIMKVRLWNRATGRTVKVRRFKVSDSTPIGEWVRASVGMRIPRRVSKPMISVFLFAPVGTVHFSAAGLFYAEHLLSGETDTVVAAKRLVRHAQDPGHQKSDLAIAAVGKDSGVVTHSRVWFHHHRNVWETLKGWTKGDAGFDFELDYRNRVLRFHHPRRGERKPEFTVQGGATQVRYLESFEMVEDGEKIYTTVLMLGGADGPSREEGFARDTSATGGIVYERVVVRQHARVRRLDALAKGTLNRSKEVPESLSVTTSAGAELLRKVEPGDTLPVRIDHGDVQIDDDRRVLGMDFDLTANKCTLHLGRGV
jgi:hypothetical protein